MELFEFYKADFEKAKTDRWYEESSKRAAEIHGYGTFKWFYALAQQYFGGGYLPRYLKSGITLQQLKEAKEQGIVKYKYYANWLALQTKRTDWWALTVKGMKEFYKYCKEQGAF